MDLARAEREFCEGVAHLPLALESLAEGEAAVGLPPTGIARTARGALARFDASFRAMYRAAAPTWVEGAPRPRMLCDLPARLTELAGNVGARGTAFILMTGLRWDLWRRFQKRVIAQVGGLQPR